MTRKFRSYLLNLIAVVALYIVFSLLIDGGVLSRSNKSTLLDVGIAIIMANVIVATFFISILL